MPGLINVMLRLISRLQNLETDLKMQGNDYNFALCMFFVTYLSPKFGANRKIHSL
jgi:hypothetical protein